MSLKRIACALLVWVGAAAPTGAQALRLSGVVLDERQVPISGAAVRLSGGVADTTGPAGRFEFTGVVPGRYIISVAAVGFQLRSVELSIMRDTLLTLAMSRRAVMLDTLVVRPRQARIKATAIDSASGDYLLQAQATLYPGGRFASAASGVFVFDSVPPGPTTIFVEALEHLPVRVDLNANRDTVFIVKMGIDSVAIRMIGIQVKRLQSRSNSLPMPTKILNRDGVVREGASNLHELILRRSYEDPAEARKAFVESPDNGCNFVDDIKVSRAVFEAMQPELVERIEIYKNVGLPPDMDQSAKNGRWDPRTKTQRNFGTIAMIRVYTKRYVATLPRQQVLQQIVYRAGQCA
jgi:hypothetical protein